MAGQASSETPASGTVRLTGADATFSVGQDVQLAAEHARDAESEGLAVAGTVTGVEQEKDGTYTYTVCFPGETGTQRGLTAEVLETVESPAVRLTGIGALSIKDAEELLIEFSAGGGPFLQKDKAHRRPVSIDGPQLFERLAAASGMGLGDLLDQILDKITRRKQEIQAERKANPAAVAASDIAQPPAGGAVPTHAPPFDRASGPSAMQHRSGPRL